jgi:hypothetical protein
MTSSYWDNMAKFIFISTQENFQPFPVLNFLHHSGILNAIAVSDKKGELKVFTFNPFAKTYSTKLIALNTKLQGIEAYFPDKLKNLQQYKYNVGANNEYPNIYMKRDHRIFGINYNMLIAIFKHQNASMKIYFEAHESKEGLFLRLMALKKFDLVLKTKYYLREKETKNINTFQTNGLCAILPYPRRRSFFALVLKPFEVWTWLGIAGSAFCLSFVWYLFNKRSTHNANSAGYFFFGFIAYFLGQSVEFRNRRLLQTILIQLMILLTFIFGNLYQSELISLMGESKYGVKITSIQGMIDSTYSFLVDPALMRKSKAYGGYQQLHSKFSGIFQRDDFSRLHEISANQTGIILSCRVITSMFTDAVEVFNFSQRAIDYFYRVPEKLNTFYNYFPTAPFSPFADRLQEYFSRMFESGIRQHWSDFVSFEDMSVVKQREAEANEEFLLRFDDTFGAFYCLGIGLAVSLIAFLLEVFWRKEVYRRCRGRHRVAPAEMLFERVDRKTTAKKSDEDEIEIYEIV